MPLVNIPRDPLFEALGRTFTEVEFEELCWDFGIELDEVVTEEVKGTNTRGKASDDAPAEEVVFKVEVPANRYDILCLEGMVRALAVFLGTGTAPEYKLLTPPGGKALQMIVEPSTAQIRPFVVCAVLRNCSFTERAYNSFLDLQDKFHHNICRRRTLVAIGTHDLSKLTPPFRYRALPPKDISFVPLAQEQEYDAASLFAMYEKSNSPIKKFLPIIASSPVYPVIYDATDTVLSLPPIINGNHSRISKDTKDVFIECTGTDLTKLNTVLNNIVAMFSEYTSMLRAAPWRRLGGATARCLGRLGCKPSGLGRSKHYRGAPRPLRPPVAAHGAVLGVCQRRSFCASRHPGTPPPSSRSSPSTWSTPRARRTPSSRRRRCARRRLLRLHLLLHHLHHLHHLHRQPPGELHSHPLPPLLVP